MKMYHVNGKAAFTIKQAIYYAENMAREEPKPSKPIVVTLPDGTELHYSQPSGDLVMKSPTPISFATPLQAARIFGFFFEGVEQGWIDLSPRPQMQMLHDYLHDKRDKE